MGVHTDILQAWVQQWKHLAELNMFWRNIALGSCSLHLWRKWLCNISFNTKACQEVLIQNQVHVYTNHTHQVQQDNKYYSVYLNIVQTWKCFSQSKDLHWTVHLYIFYICMCSGCNKVWKRNMKSVRAGKSEEAGTTRLTMAVPCDWGDCFFKAA